MSGATVATEPEVLAGGGAVWRRGPSGVVEVLVVHRPRYDDWSLPKGKVDPGETEVEAAVREVQEETGLTCTLGVELTSVHYIDRKGRRKRVRYWSMQVARGAFEANHEVDVVRWLTLDAATALLSYPHDRTVLESLRRTT